MKGRAIATGARPSQAAPRPGLVPFSPSIASYQASLCQGQSRCKACAPHMPAMHSLTLTSQCHHNHSLANDSHVQCGRTVAGVCVSRETVWQNEGSRVWRLCGQSAVLGGSSSSQVQHGESVARLCFQSREPSATIFLTFRPTLPYFALFPPFCLAFPAYRFCHNPNALQSYSCH